MVKLLMKGSDADRNKQISKFEKEFKNQEEKIRRIQDLYLDGGLSKEDYNSMRTRYSADKVLIERKLNEFMNVNTGLKKSLEKGVGILSNIGNILRCITFKKSVSIKI